MSTFGERLKKLREDKDLSIGDLISELNKRYDTKVSKSMISRYENGQTDPKMEVVRIIADYFKVSLDYLIGLKEEPFTIAAHHDGEDWTEEELQTIETFKAYVRSIRKKEK
ncbi:MULTISPECIES: helix-turn-helix domain-containing protein [Bacillus subtilis group]|uniref:helix-turn-helix domain-containing protein n=1 Tax=Bacillus subtilis group TaxID=653685 RepID=UPI000367343A|nr:MULTISPECIES: helix-turn-helix transcriptional regulator [Bacillus subtilis group]WOH90914.1 helix-turn-helix transcriptional regulator [Bacillus paralicheniformis]